MYFLLIYLFCCTLIQSQTVLNYQTWTGATGCNIFANSTSVPASINGAAGSITHLTAIGQPTYNNFNNAVSLSSQFVNFQNRGTEYRTTVNFKKGYGYKITVNAARILSQQSGIDSPLRLDLNNGGSGNNTLCNGFGVIDPNTTGNLKQSLNINSSSFKDYIFNYSSLSTAQSYLMVAAIPAYNSGYQTILIRKITIEETAAPPSFSLTSSPTNIACGVTTPVTFTATGSNIPNGATVSYSWNLGANNGWQYNGSAAPSIISTGTSNVLTLTPICGSSLSNVSITASVNSSTYNSNGASVLFTQPSLTIIGNSAFCSGSSSYSVSNVPCNGTVSWTSSNTSVGTISATGNPATLTKTGDGNVTITASVNGVGCLSSNTISKTIALGAPQASNISLWSSQTSTTNGSPVGFVAGYPPSNRCQIQSTDWQVSMSASVTTGDFPCEPDNGTSKNIFFQSTGTAYVQARILNSCGWSGWSAGVPIQVSSGYYFLVSPNPATTTLTVQQKNNKNEDINVIRIYDDFGNLKKQTKFGQNTKQAQLYISDLKAGIYFIEILGKQKNERQQIIIQR